MAETKISIGICTKDDKDLHPLITAQQAKKPSEEDAIKKAIDFYKGGDLSSAICYRYEDNGFLSLNVNRTKIKGIAAAQLPKVTDKNPKDGDRPTWPLVLAACLVGGFLVARFRHELGLVRLWEAVTRRNANPAEIPGPVEAPKPAEEAKLTSEEKQKVENMIRVRGKLPDFELLEKYLNDDPNRPEKFVDEADYHKWLYQALMAEVDPQDYEKAKDLHDTLTQFHEAFTQTQAPNGRSAESIVILTLQEVLSDGNTANAKELHDLGIEVAERKATEEVTPQEDPVEPPKSEISKSPTMDEIREKAPLTDEDQKRGWDALRPEEKLNYVMTYLKAQKHEAMISEIDRLAGDMRDQLNDFKTRENGERIIARAVLTAIENKAGFNGDIHARLELSFEEQRGALIHRQSKAETDVAERDRLERMLEASKEKADKLRARAKDGIKI